MEGTKNNVLTVPIAIIIAGLLIAGAVFFARGGGESRAATGEREGGAKAISALFGGSETSEIPDQPASLGGIPAIQIGKDHLLGNPNADVIIVEYSDLECPFCRVFHQTLQRIMSDYGKAGTVAWAYRHFPLTQLHSKAVKEAEATECAAELGGNEGFWKFTDRLFEITPSNDGLDASQLPDIAEYGGLERTAFEACLKSGKHLPRIQAEYNEAAGAGGTGTPFSILLLRKPLSSEATQAIFPMYERYRDPRTGLLPISVTTDGQRMSLSGAMPYEVMKATIDALLK